MTYKMITDSIIDEMLNDVFTIKLNSYLKKSLIKSYVFFVS